MMVGLDLLLRMTGYCEEVELDVEEVESLWLAGGDGSSRLVLEVV